MESKNLGGILDKINELRALFIFGQRVIPFLEELFYFVNDIVPVLEEINLSIYESAKRIPRASSQLNKVTEETEVATTEILDNLDGVLAKLDGIDKRFYNAIADLTTLETLDDELLTLIETSLDPTKAGVLTEITALQRRKRLHTEALRTNAENLDKTLKEIRRNSNDIMISLQVQDITSQQIASVNHLIQSIQERLSGLINKFKISGADLANEMNLTSDVPFDPMAVYDRSQKRQRTVDNIMNVANSKKKTPNQREDNAADPASQDEIDRLFRNGIE